VGDFKVIAGDDPGSFRDYAHNLPARSIVFALVAVACLAAMGMYKPHMREGPTGALLRITGAFVAATLIMSVIFYLYPRLYLWRGIFVYTAVVGFVTCLICWMVFTRLIDLDQFKRNVLVYGSGYSAATITTAMRRKSDRRGFNIVGFVVVGDVQVNEELLRVEGSLAEFARLRNIDEIVVALDERGSALPIDELVACRTNGIQVVDIVNFFEREARKILVDFVSPKWLIFSDGFKHNDFSRFLQRGLDIFAGILLLALAWPIMLATVLAIKLEEGPGAPVIFRQSRVGLNGKIFEVLKFRSMRVDAEGDGKARWATLDDDRVTRVGNVIRKLRIDELPQIINVLVGDMSLIGPRPERPEFVDDLAQRIPYYNTRHLVKPGITGWAQLLYPYGASDHDAKQKLQFDLYYVKNHSIFLDFWILLTTVEVVLFGKGAR
jgi:sugar transferase (PEP-CTERM system associated)